MLGPTPIALLFPQPLLLSVHSSIVAAQRGRTHISLSLCDIISDLNQMQKGNLIRLMRRKQLVTAGLCSLSPVALCLSGNFWFHYSHCIKPPLDVFHTDPLSTNAEKLPLFCSVAAILKSLNTLHFLWQAYFKVRSRNSEHFLL